MRNIFISLLFYWVTTLGFAQPSLQPLPADQAFAISTVLTPSHQLLVEWKIAPGYYLYQDKMSFTVAPTSQVKLGKIILPKAQIRHDHAEGPYKAYSGDLKVNLPLLAPVSGTLNLTIGYQGCSSGGFCYSPTLQHLTLNLASAKTLQKPHLSIMPPVVTTPAAPLLSNQTAAAHIFDGHGLLFIIASFLGLGLLLAFTPCVLPMIPILSGIIVGHGKGLTTLKAFFLSLAYVLGAALTYAIAGIVVALIGSSLQANLQRPSLIIIGSILFVLLALSLFGFYELQLPAHWRQRLTALSNRQKGGHYLGVFCMGILSALIVSPCVSAPLVGVLAYIANAGSVVIGGVALLALGIGMGLPLLLLGASAGKLLPKAGTWMLIVERLFGILMLGYAIWLISRIIPGPATLFLWAILLICSSLFMGVFTPATDHKSQLARGLGVVVLIYGMILMTGAVLGNSDPLNPWNGWKAISDCQAANQKTSFRVVNNLADLNQQLLLAKKMKKPVLLDFYADWCASCVAMDRRVFSDSAVQAATASMLLLRVDVTANSAAEHAIMRHFHVIAPPTILFFNASGKELPTQRIIGEQSAKEFIQRLQQLK